MSGKRIAILGGTFNPIHNGHIALAKGFAELLDLQEVLLMVTNVPPHKQTPNLASGEDRLEMCRLAAAEEPCLTVCDLELRRSGKSYTWETLTELHEAHPEDTFFFITGADMFLTLESWKYPERIFQLCTVCTSSRGKDSVAELRAYGKQLESLGAKTVVAEFLPPDISSTDVRRKIASGESVTGLIPASVERYIKDRGLYREEGEILPYRTEIERILSPFRAHHSVCVAQKAEQLARRYGADPQKALIAGILHDSTKEMSPQEQLQMMEKFGIMITPVEFHSHKLYHAITGAVNAKERFGITDPEILDAIRYHTTARAGMTLLDKVLCLADYVSDDRNYPGVEELRKKAEQQLESTLTECLAFTIDEVLKGGGVIHPDTIAAYNELLLEQMSENPSGK